MQFQSERNLIICSIHLSRNYQKNYLLKQKYLDKSIDVFELLILILVNAENFMSLWQVGHGKQNVLSRYKLPYKFHVTMSRLVFMKTVTFKML